MKKKTQIITKAIPNSTAKYVNKSHLAHNLRAFFFIFFVILALFFLQVLVFLNNGYTDVRANYDSKTKEFEYWKSVSSQYPTIPDVLYNTSLSALKAGKKNEAVVYVDKAIKLDPLFKEAIILKRTILEEN